MTKPKNLLHQVVMMASAIVVIFTSKLALAFPNPFRGARRWYRTTKKVLKETGEVWEAGKEGDDVLGYLKHYSFEAQDLIGRDIGHFMFICFTIVTFSMLAALIAPLIAARARKKREKEGKPPKAPVNAYVSAITTFIGSYLLAVALGFFYQGLREMGRISAMGMANLIVMIVGLVFFTCLALHWRSTGHFFVALFRRQFWHYMRTRELAPKGGSEAAGQSGPGGAGTTQGHQTMEDLLREQGLIPGPAPTPEFAPAIAGPVPAAVGYVTHAPGVATPSPAQVPAQVPVTAGPKCPDPDCGYRSRPGANFCGKCCTQLKEVVEKKVTCPNPKCKKWVEDRPFCRLCGYPLKAKQEAPKPKPAHEPASKPAAKPVRKKRRQGRKGLRR